MELNIFFKHFKKSKNNPMCLYVFKKLSVLDLLSSIPNFEAYNEAGQVDTQSYKQDPPCDAPYFACEPLGDVNLSETGNNKNDAS